MIPGLGRCPREGKGYPLQYSGLENSMGCVVHGVAKRQTRLSSVTSQERALAGPSCGTWEGPGDCQVCKPRAPSTRPRLPLGIWGQSKGSVGHRVLPAPRPHGPRPLQRRTSCWTQRRWMNGLHAVPPAATGGQCALRNGQCACVSVCACMSVCELRARACVCACVCVNVSV